MLDSLINLSASVGADRSLVQGAGGNSSLKEGDRLWVKASGKWLRDAQEQPIFVPVDLDGVRTRIAAGAGEDLAGLCLDESGMRPSIETTLHALMPHRVVLHVHCLDTLAWAVRADAEALMTAKLAGLAWRFVPYRRPGLPLTEAVAAALASGRSDVLVLGNHGLVIGGDDAEQVSRLLADVRHRLRCDIRSFTPPERPVAGMPEGFAWPEDTHSQALAFDPGRHLAAAGSLYPDHVVFLGSGYLLLPPEARHAPSADTALLAVDDTAVFVRSDLSAGALAMVGALADLCRRLAPEAPLRYLTDEQELELLGWDAEKYRQRMNNQGAHP